MKKMGLGLAAVVAVVLGLVVGFVAFLHTGPGERWVSGKVEEVAAGQVELDGYQLRWPFRMKADYLRVLDREGTWLEVTRPEFRWQPQRLLRHELHVDRLAAAKVVVRRPPLPSGELAAEEAGGLPDIDGTLLLEELTALIVLDPPVLGERLELDLGGTFQMRGGGGSVDLHLRSSGGALARVAGTAGNDYLDLRWYLRVPELARWERLAGVRLAGEAVGSGVVAGRLPHPAVSGRLELGEGRADEARWDGLAIAGRVVPGQLLNFSLTAEAARPRWGDEQAPVPFAVLSATGDLAPEPGRLRFGHARLEGGGMTLSASGVVDNWGRSATLRASGELPDLSRFGMVGRASVQAVLAGDLLAQDLRGRVQARASGFTSGTDILDRLAGPAPTADALVAVRGGRVLVEDATVTGAGASLRAQGEVGSTLDLWARASLPDMNVLAPQLKGVGTAWARIAGPVENPAVSGVAQVPEGVVGFDLGDLAGQPRGVVTADLSLAGQPIHGRTRLTVGKEVRFDELRVTSGNAVVEGELAVVGEGVRGRLRGSIPELKAWEKLAGMPLAGRLEADAVLDPASRQSARVTARGGGLAAAGVTIGSAGIRADLANLAARPSGSVAIEAETLARGDVALDRLTARLQGDGTAFGFELDGVGAGGRVDAAGTARLDGAAGQARLERLRLAFGQRNAALAQPTSVRWGKEGVALAPSVLTIGPGRLDVEGRLAGKALSGRARLDEVPLEVVELFAPDLDAVGRVSGTASLAGTLDAPRARVELAGRNVGFAAAARAGLGRLSTRLAADWRDNRADVEVSALDGERIQASATLSLPLPGEGPLSGRFEVTGDAGRLSEALPLPGHVFAGRLDAEGRIAGTLAQPLISGRADLTKGRYENLESGTIVSPLAARAEFQGDRIRVTAEGGDGGRGSVRAEGSGGLDGSFGADLVLDRFTALRRDDVEAEVNGTLRLAGGGGQGRIEGRLAVPRAEIDIARLKGSGPVTLDVVEINKPGQRAAPPRREAPEAEAAPVTLALALAVDVERAFVRGRGLDSEWQGNVAVGGTLSEPSLTGRLVAARGDFDFLGKQFRLADDSAVVFQGGDTIDPRLEVLAQARAEDITAQVELTGTVKAPELAITSQPPLPQDEVLARVLFGREAGKLSAFQQIQLAQMAATGLTGGEGFDPIGRVRGFLGLDVLGVGSAEAPARPGEDASSGPTVSAGKYIGRDTFVRVEQGTAGLGEVTVEQELGGGFSVETSVGEQSGGGVGFNWRKDY